MNLFRNVLLNGNRLDRYWCYAGKREDFACFYGVSIAEPRVSKAYVNADLHECSVIQSYIESEAIRFNLVNWSRRFSRKLDVKEIAEINCRRAHEFFLKLRYVDARRKIEVKRRACLAQPVVEGYATLQEPYFGVFSDQSRENALESNFAS